VHEHGSEERQPITAGIGKEAARHESPLSNKRVTATQLYKEKQDIQSDQGIRDQRNSSTRGIIITDWEHKIYLLLLWLDLSQLHIKMSLAFFKESDLLAINIYLQLKEKRPTSLSKKTIKTLHIFHRLGSQSSDGALSVSCS
jgi:hypothetical protein